MVSCKGDELFKIDYLLHSVDIAAWNRFFKDYCIKCAVSEDYYCSNHPLALFEKYPAIMFEGMTQ